MTRKSSKFIIAGGFSALMAFMILVTLIGFLRFASIHNEVNRISNEHYTKTSLLNAMRISVRERAVSLILMANLSDPFEQDREMLRFNQLGSEFADARTALLQLPLTSNERETLIRQSALTLEARPLHDRLIDMSLRGDFVAAHRFLAKTVIPKQDEIVETVKEIQKQENEDYQRRITAVNKDYRLAYVLFMALLSIGTVGFGAVITLLVTRKIDSTETKLLEEQERYALAVRGANDGLWDWDLVTNEIYFSARWKDMLGWDDHEIENRVDEWMKRIHIEDSEKTLAALNAHLNGLTHYFESEHRLLHKDGSYRWFLMRGLALRDEHGKAYRIAGSSTDISERKRYEKHLHQNESRMRMVLDHVVDGIVTTSDRGMIESVNTAAEEMFGLKADQMVGRPFCRLLAEPYRHEYERHFLDYANTGSLELLSANTELRGLKGLRPGDFDFTMTCTITEMQISNDRKLIVIVRDTSKLQKQAKKTA